MSYTAHASIQPIAPLIWANPGSSVRLFRVKINCRGRAGYAGIKTDVRCFEAGHEGVHVHEVGTSTANCKSCITCAYLIDAHVEPTLIPRSLNNKTSTPPADGQTQAPAANETNACPPPL